MSLDPSAEIKPEKEGDAVNPCESDPREDIQHVEKAPAARPKSATFVGIRSSFTNQREELKRAIVRSRSLGSQLDSCKSAVECSMKRRADGALKLEEAKRALHTADLDEKNVWNWPISKTHVQCASTSPSANSLAVFSTAVARVLHDPKSVSAIPQSFMGAEQEMKTLLAKLSSRATHSAPPTGSGAKHPADTNVG